MQFMQSTLWWSI